MPATHPWGLKLKSLTATAGGVGHSGGGGLELPGDLNSFIHSTDTSMFKWLPPARLWLPGARWPSCHHDKARGAGRSREGPGVTPTLSVGELIPEGPSSSMLLSQPHIGGGSPAPSQEGGSWLASPAALSSIPGTQGLSGQQPGSWACLRPAGLCRGLRRSRSRSRCGHPHMHRCSPQPTWPPLSWLPARLRTDAFRTAQQVLEVSGGRRACLARPGLSGGSQDKGAAGRLRCR